MTTVLLSETELAIARHDLRSALLHALAAWRATRDGTIGDAIDTLTAKALLTFKPPSQAGRAKLHATWLAIAGSDDPIAHGWLAASIDIKLPEPTRTARRERVAAIGRLAPDPRFLVERDVEGVLSLRSFPQDWVAWGDDRVRAMFEARAVDDPFFRNLLPSIPETARVPDAEQRRWRAISGRPDPAALAKRDALVAAVYDAPDDDVPRMVLADHLQELGDPQGTLIAMQLAGTDHDQALRIHALLDQYGNAWSGRLAKFATRIRFRRGFPSRVWIGDFWHVDNGSYYAVDDPAWSTIEAIEGPLSPSALALAIRSPMLRALREVTIETNDVLEAVEERRPAVTTIRSRGWHTKDEHYFERLMKRVVPLARMMPSVTTLDVSMDSIDLLLQDPIIRQLRELQTPGVPSAIVHLWRVAPATIERVSSSAEVTFEIRRDPEGVVCRVDRSYGVTIRDIVSAVIQIPDLARVELVYDTDGKVRAAIEKKRRVELVDVIGADQHHALAEIRT